MLMLEPPCVANGDPSSRKMATDRTKGSNFPATAQRPGPQLGTAGQREQPRNDLRQRTEDEPQQPAWSPHLGGLLQTQGQGLEQHASDGGEVGAGPITRRWI